MKLNSRFRKALLFVAILATLAFVSVCIGNPYEMYNIAAHHANFSAAFSTSAICEGAIDFAEWRKRSGVGGVAFVTYIFSSLSISGSGKFKSLKQQEKIRLPG